MRVLRYFHAARDDAQRRRDEALVRAGAEVTLVVPRTWPGPDRVEGGGLVEIVEVEVRRAGDVNRHTLADPRQLDAVTARLRPDVVDLLEEPFSALTHQVLGRLDPTVPLVHYTAQNLDKRYPPPFSRWERRALARIDALYPCSRQAASVAVGKGFGGIVDVLPLGVDPAIRRGTQQLPAEEVRLLLVGRLVPHKGVLDAVETLATLHRSTPASLSIVGSGPESARAAARAAELGVADRLEIHEWTDLAGLAEHYARAHVLLAPSRATRTWVEQFGRMIVEAQAAGAVVVGYASGSIPEVAGSAGVLVTEGDRAALGRAVRALAAEPERWAALREVGLRASESCTWDAIAAAQLELYAAARRGPSGRRLARPDRAAAVAVFGPPARVPGSARPFALPVLRDGNAATRLLEDLADAVAASPRPSTGALRVVHLDHTATLSGGEIALARLLAATPGTEAHVILAEDGPLRRRLARAGTSVEVMALPARAREVDRTAAIGSGGLAVAATTAVYTLRLARRLRRLRPDVVHTHSLKAGYYGSLAARLAGVPVVWHVRDRIAEDYLPRPAVRLTRLALRHLPDLVVTNSEATAETLGLHARVVSEVYAPVRTPTPAPSQGTSYRVAVLGRLSPWKGQDVVLRAMVGVPEVSVRFVGSAMFGEDAYAASLRTLADDLGVADRVVWVGFVDDIEQQLAEVDVVVHSSVVPEPFGQVVIEGMAAGRAVVATAAGGPAEIITDGVDGLLVAAGDVGALREALRSLRDRTRRDLLAAAASRRAEDFRPDRTAPELEQLWLDAARARRHSDP